MLHGAIHRLTQTIRKQIDYDAMMCIGAEMYKDSMIVSNGDGSKKRHLFPRPIPKSIVHTVLKSLQPRIANDVDASCLYHPESDNPFAYRMDRMAVIPCGAHESARAPAILVLYREKRGDNGFKKEEIESIQKVIRDHIALNQALHQKVLRRLLPTDPPTAESHHLKYELDQANRFFSSVVHDIRTPMNAVMGFLELLEDEVVGQHKEYVHAAYQSSEMVTALINDVLDFNKIAMGKMEINAHYFSLLDVVKNTALLFYHTAVKKGIDFIIYVDPKIPYLIKSDPFRIKQVLNNLLSNAIKFTDAGGMVTMEFGYESAEDTLICKVSDTGIGISKEAQQSIFSPFTQASSATSSHYGGTGLGLTISRQLVRLLDGEIFLESAPNKGSEFRVHLPCDSIEDTGISLEVERDALPKVYLIDGALSHNRYIIYFERYFEALGIAHEVIHEEDALHHTDAAHNIYVAMKLDYSSTLFHDLVAVLKGRLMILETDMRTDVVHFPPEVLVLEMPIFPDTILDALMTIARGDTLPTDDRAPQAPIPNREKVILIADDNLMNLKLVEEIVRKLGFASEVAKNGQEAVDIFREKGDRLDAILIDQNMPIMNGTDAIQIIRSLPGGAQPSIYGLTGDSDEQANREMQEAGADAILHKPVRLKALRSVLNSA